MRGFNQAVSTVLYSNGQNFLFRLEKFSWEIVNLYGPEREKFIVCMVWNASHNCYKEHLMFCYFSDFFSSTSDWRGDLYKYSLEVWFSQIFIRPLEVSNFRLHRWRWKNLTNWAILSYHFLDLKKLLQNGAYYSAKKKVGAYHALRTSLYFQARPEAF